MSHRSADPLLPILRRLCLSSSLALAFAPVALLAQNTVGFSFDGAWLASGRTSEANPASAPSYVSLIVRGFPEVRVPIARGDDAGDLTVKCILALARAGFDVTLEGPTRFRVTGHTSGQPIGGGGAIGENDDDLRGVDLDVVRGEHSFAQPGPMPSELGFGLARPTGNQPSQGGTLTTTLEYEGVPAPTVVVVQVPPGTMPAQIDQMMFAAFVQHGIVPRDWQAPGLVSPAASQPLFGLVRDVAGHLVRHVVFVPDVEPEILAMHLQSCMPIRTGAVEFGWSWPSPGLHLDTPSTPRIGSPLQLALDTPLPNTFAGFVVGLAGLAQPLPMLSNGTPAPTGDGPTLFVQPLVTIQGITDAAGRLQFVQPLPADPGLVGLPLHWQGFDLGAPWPTTFWLANGLLTIVGG